MNIEKVRIIFHIITIATLLIWDDDLLFPPPPSTQDEPKLIHSSDKVYEENENFHKMNTLTFQVSHFQFNDSSF